ncbi:Rieske (2Fe-2S) protein [Saccharopolyspora gregorii]|uniref:Rieske domain-containing protein n=1 Tax=Saccharopolyspora gregorii TaxID=33914 RepID=A0ABP6RLY2_9PSEU|nr:Rieske 2Fe-2S domain-containing protein [Saccharopolyspora gregorii]
MVSSENSRPAQSWVPVPGVSDLAPGEVVTTKIGGEFIAVCNAGGVVRAFRDECPQCALPIGGGRLLGDLLWCAGCAEPFDVSAGGVGRKRARFRLAARSLTVSEGSARIALSA